MLHGHEPLFLIGCRVNLFTLLLGQELLLRILLLRVRVLAEEWWVLGVAGAREVASAVLVGGGDGRLGSDVDLVVLFACGRPQLLHPQVALHEALLLDVHVGDRVGVLRNLVVGQLAHRRRLLLLLDHDLAGLTRQVVHMGCLLHIKLLRLNHLRAKSRLLIKRVRRIKAARRYLAHIRGALTTLFLILFLFLVYLDGDAMRSSCNLVTLVLWVLGLSEGLL